MASFVPSRRAAAVATLAALGLLVGTGAAPATDDGADQSLTTQTYDWGGDGDAEMKLSTNVMPMEQEPEIVQRRGLPDLLHGERRLGDGGGDVGANVQGTGNVLDALWSRPDWRDARYQLKRAEGEHPCFAGFSYMMNHTNRCGGWMRTYPEVGGTRNFVNRRTGSAGGFTLQAVVKGNVNVWTEDGTTTEEHTDIATKAARIYTNDLNIEELRPAPESSSWMEHECKVFGTMPFMYTCSNRINILVQRCDMENAFVMQGDYLENFPGPANAQSGPNFDIVFYMCRELIDRNPNPYAAADTFAHELAHVIQGGFGFSSNVMTEGGATWLEGPLLNMPNRPMVYAYGFKDWNSINAAHIYANTKGLNSRKFYQVHAMLLTYLSQPELLGNAGASSLQNYQTFERDHVPFGRASYDYFLKYVGKGIPDDFEPMTIDLQDTDNAYATTLLNFRVALASQCIEDANKRPTEAKYLMPASVRERPFWDCTSYPTYWSADSTSTDGAEMAIHYGGAAVSRLMMPVDATISIAPDADVRIRTKVLAAGTFAADGTKIPAEVRELVPGDKVKFAGAREIYVVQVNVDPQGESISARDQPKLWKRSEYRCVGKCSGHAWYAGRGHGLPYPDNELSALRSPMLELPANASQASLSFDAMWNLEAAITRAGTKVEGCPAIGYDGVQVRVHVYEGNMSEIMSSRQGGHHEGSGVHVVLPRDGYTSGADGQMAISAFSDTKLYRPQGTCEDFYGWTGDSSNQMKGGEELEFLPQWFDLSPYVGKRVRFEVLFASDGGIGSEGFWLDNIVVRADDKVVFTDFANPPSTDKETMFVHIPMATTRLGEIGKDDGVPVVAALPHGHEFDRSLTKAHESISAPWSATWTAVAGAEAGPEAALRRAYVGWSYSSPTTSTKTTVLHPWQESCVTMEAPFRGAPKSALLFALVDKIGVSALQVTAREAAAPYKALGTPAVSRSDGVADPGTHRFHLAGAVPTIEAGEQFLLCVGVAEVKPLPADGNNEPFVHLPLTDAAPSTSEEGKPGATFIRAVEDHGGLKAGETSKMDPYEGRTLSLRAEFVEAAMVEESAGSGRRLRGVLLQ